MTRDEEAGVDLDVFDPDDPDDQDLLERATHAWHLLKTSSEDIDPFEALAAVVWPSSELLELQRAARAT